MGGVRAGVLEQWGAKVRRILWYLSGCPVLACSVFLCDKNRHHNRCSSARSTGEGAIRGGWFGCFPWSNVTEARFENSVITAEEPFNLRRSINY